MILKDQRKCFKHSFNQVIKASVFLADIKDFQVQKLGKRVWGRFALCHVMIVELSGFCVLRKSVFLIVIHCDRQ